MRYVKIFLRKNIICQSLRRENKNPIESQPVPVYNEDTIMGWILFLFFHKFSKRLLFCLFME